MVRNRDRTPSIEDILNNGDISKWIIPPGSSPASEPEVTQRKPWLPQVPAEQPPREPAPQPPAQEPKRNPPTQPE
jgi:hypothetical protein